MTQEPLIPLRRQLARVRRRLLLFTLADALAWCWAGALLLAAGWLLAEPLLPGERAEWLRWAVPGGAGLAATLLAVVLAVLRAPGRVEAALLLDRHFGLKERITTALTLDRQTAGLPVGQALLADAAAHVAGLDLGTRFPVRVRWNAWLVPLAGLALAAVAFLYDPARTRATTDGDKLSPASWKEFEKRAEELRKMREKKLAEKARGEKAQVLDDELQKILNQPHETREEVRDRLKDLTALGEKANKERDELKDRARAVKDQLRQVNRSAGADARDGPAKEVQKALDKGDFKKAQEELEKLRKKMEDGESPLTEKDREQLRQQLGDMKEKLRRAADPEEARKQLEQLRRDGRIDSEQLEKAMEQVRRNAAQMSADDRKALEDLAGALGECEGCMKEGDGARAADALKRAGRALRTMDDLMRMQDELQEELDQLAACKRCCGRCLTAGVGDGRRPEGEPHETGSYDSTLHGRFDPKGAQEITGYAPGTSFKKKGSAEIAGEIKQASQDAPDTIEHQRIPRAASDMARGYFENIRKLSGDDDKK